MSLLFHCLAVLQIYLHSWLLLSSMCQPSCIHSTDGWPGIPTVLCSAPKGSHSAGWLWLEGRWDCVRVFLPAQETGLGNVVILVFLPFHPTLTRSVQFGLVVPLPISSPVTELFPFAGSYLTSHQTNHYFCPCFKHLLHLFCWTWKGVVPEFGSAKCL